MIKILILFGTRPEAIKLYPVIKYFNESDLFDVRVCSTGQHREMLDQVLNFFKIVPDYELNLMRSDQSLSILTSDILREVSRCVLAEFKPDWIIVQGDTTSAMAGALAGFYERIKIVHIEAGLRSFDLTSPFPEEMNRQVISKLATAHFCPTAIAVKNLNNEGILNHVYEVGNTIVDSVTESINLLKKSNQQSYYNLFSDIDFTKKVILVTCHRRESFGEPFRDICMALRELADSGYEIVYPVHLNPNIKQKASEYLQHPSIKLLLPLAYHELLWLMSKSSIVLTDSGGLQEEAPSLGKPVLVLRNVTERMEGIEAGTAILTGSQTQKIVVESLRLLSDESHYQSMLSKKNPYGDGQASSRIGKIIKRLS